MTITPLSSALTHETYIYVTVAPNPVGVNQDVFITFILPSVPPAQLPPANPRYGYWSDITITITKPDGTTQNITNLETGEAAAGYTVFTPTQTGTYKFQAHFPGAIIETGPRAGDYYTPCVSPIYEITVQDNPVQPIPEYTLPTNYWTFPIEGQNRQWNILAGNWLAGDTVNASTNGYNPYTTAPGSAHILWTKQQIPGGIVGGSYGSDIYNYGRWPSSGNGAYFGPPIIINGILYINEPQYTGSGVGFKAINIATGETLWKNEVNDALTFATIYEFKSRMMSNVYAYLWATSGNTMRIYEASTGKLFQTIENVTSGTRAFGPSGELLIYQISGTSLRMWNSTLYFYSTTSSPYGPLYAPNNIWAPDSGTFDFNGGWQWSVTLTNDFGSINQIIPNELLILRKSFSATDTTNPIDQHTAINIRTGIYTDDKSGQQAQILWGPVNRTLYIDNAGYERIEAIGDGIYVMYKRELLQIVGFDAYTGNQLWITEPMDDAFAMFSGQSRNFIIAEDKVFVGGYDGTMYAFNAKTGALEWKTNVGSSNYETAYGSYPLGGSYDTFKAGGGVLWVGVNEHSPSIVPYKNGKIYAFNTTDGTIIWSLMSTLSEVQCPAIYGGMYIYLNGYDGKIYCIGKGPSKTTVTATAGIENAITIQGTVIDNSHGANQLVEAGLFNNVPAISDESQSAWMEYLYMQKPKPTNATGVPVSILISDNNNNIVYTTTTTTDISGHYILSWIPETKGTYKITATFDGSESYYSSIATTGIAVGENIQPQPTTITSINEQTSTTAETILIMGTAIIIIILIATMAIVLKKRR